MSSRILNVIRILLLLAVLVAAAATPTLADAKTKKPAKKMKINFDGSSTASDDPLRPRASNRSYESSGETVRLRGQSIDDIWAASGGDSTAATSSYVAPKRSAKLAKKLPPARKVSKVATYKKSTNHSKKTVVAAKIAPVVYKVATRESDFEDLTKEAKSARETYQPARPKLIPREAPARPFIASNTRLETSTPTEFKFLASLENTFTLARPTELEEVGGRNFALKNELFIGATEKSGWGAQLAVPFRTTSNADTSRDVREFGDVSVILAHPSLYKSSDLDVYGRFRYYAPVAESSRAVGIHHFAYYLIADLKLASQVSVANIFIPRYFSQSEYLDSDAYALLYDATEITKLINSSWSIGLGQQTQIESHHMTAAGTSIEAYPFINFTGLSKVLVQAKVYLPLYVSNTVGGAPAAAGISSMQAELFAKLAF